MVELLDIVGQDEAVAQLLRAAVSDRRPHAYLFAGPEGVGRRTTALAFAQVLLCQNPTSVRAGQLPGKRSGAGGDLPEDLIVRLPCRQCPSCRTLQAGTNGDFHLVYKELARFHPDETVRQRKQQELSIEVIREFLIAPAYRTSAGGRGKVFVVLQADLMSPPAQNALLKTLEEPPPGVTLILVTVAAEDLLPTTRSRCQVVPFHSLPTALVADRLVQEGLGRQEAAFWAAATGGSLGRASRLAKERLYPFKQELLGRLAELAPPEQAAGKGQVAGLAELLLKQMQKHARRFTERDELLAASLANRQAGEIILELIGTVYRDALTLVCKADRPLAHADQEQAIAAVAGRFPPPALAEILTQLSRYEQLLWRNVNPKVLWDNVAITCATALAMEG